MLSWVMLGYLNITEQVTGRPISGGGAPPSPASRWLAAATSTQTLASRAPATEARTPSQERMQSRAGTRTLWCSGGSRRQRPSRGNSPARPGIAPHETARIMRIQWGKVDRARCGGASTPTQQIQVRATGAGTSSQAVVRAMTIRWLAAPSPSHWA